MNWWEDRNDLALLARYMSRAGYTAHNVAEMISEPWHWADEYAQALAWAERTQRGFAAIDVGGGA